MGLNANLGLGFLFTAKDAASGTIRKIGAGIRNLGASVFTSANIMKLGAAGIGASAVTAGAGVLGLAASFKAAAAFGEFEQGVANVGATMQATVPEMKALGAAAKQAGIDTQFSPVEATQGLDSLAAAGQTASQAIATLSPVLALAAGSKGQLGLAESAEAVVGTLNSYGLSADKAAEVTDKLLFATTKSNFQTRDFAGGLAKAAAAGSAFGQNLDTVLVTMGFLRNANIDASSSATAFRESVRRLGSDQRAQQAITSKGVDIFDEQTGAMRQLPEIMLDFAEATADLTDKERNASAARGFGARGLLAFNAIMKASFTKTLPDGTKEILKGRDALEAFRMELAQSGGTAEKMKNQLLDTFEGQKTLLRGTLETLAISFGEGFAAAIRPVVESVTTVLNFFIKAIDSIPAPAKKMIAGLILGSSAFLVLAGVLGLVLFLFVLMLPMMGTLIAVFAIATVALAPLIGAFVFVAAAVAGFRKAIARNVGGIGDFFEENFGRAKTAALALFQFFSEGQITGSVFEDLKNDQPLFDFVNKVVALGQRIGNFFKGFGTGFTNILVNMEPVFDGFITAMRRLGEALGLLSPLSEGAKDSFGAFGEAGESMGQKMGLVFSKIVEAITSMINQVIDNKDVFIDLADNVGKAASEAIKLFGAITGADLSGSTGDIDSLGKSVIEMGKAFSFAFKWIGNTIRGMRVLARALELQENPAIGIIQSFALARLEIVDGNEALAARKILLTTERARVKGILPRELNKGLRDFKAIDLIPPEAQISVQPVSTQPLVSLPFTASGTGEPVGPSGDFLPPPVIPPDILAGPAGAFFASDPVADTGISELISALSKPPAIPAPIVTVNMSIDGEDIPGVVTTTTDDSPGGGSTGV